MDPMGRKRDAIHLLDGRRAAHVKWDGKTIALGTFSAIEAAEKCERAKCLTKKWRATMVPKPDVEWVKKALERLNIRVVNDRPGRRRKDEILEKQRKEQIAAASLGPHILGGDDQMYGMMGRKDRGDNSMFFSPQGFQSGMSSANTENALSSMNQINSMSAYSINGMGSNAENGRLANSNGISRRFSDEDGAGMSQFNPMQIGNSMPSNFESNLSRNPFQPGLLARDFGIGSGGAIPGLESPGSSRQHYGVLKEHHDNLLKELQQTTYMMQMYQRNYEQKSEEPANNFMNSSMYGSNSMSGGAMASRGDSFAFGQGQSQSRQNQGFNSAIQYPYDRRNSLGLSDSILPRNSMQNAFSSAAGNMGLQMQNQNQNMMFSDMDRGSRLGFGGISNSNRSPGRRQAHRDSNDAKRPKVEQGAVSGSSEGYSSPKQEEV